MITSLEDLYKFTQGDLEPFLAENKPKDPFADLPNFVFPDKKLPEDKSLDTSSSNSANTNTTKTDSAQQQNTTQDNSQATKDNTVNNKTDTSGSSGNGLNISSPNVKLGLPSLPETNISTDLNVNTPTVHTNTEINLSGINQTTPEVPKFDLGGLVNTIKENIPNVDPEVNLPKIQGFSGSDVLGLDLGNINKTIDNLSKSLNIPTSTINSDATIRKGTADGYGEISIGNGNVLDISKIIDGKLTELASGTVLQGVNGSDLYKIIKDPVGTITNNAKDAASNLLSSSTGIDPDLSKQVVDILSSGNIDKAAKAAVSNAIQNSAMDFVEKAIPGIGQLITVAKIGKVVLDVAANVLGFNEREAKRAKEYQQEKKTEAIAKAFGIGGFEYTNSYKNFNQDKFDLAKFAESLYDSANDNIDTYNKVQNAQQAIGMYGKYLSTNEILSAAKENKLFKDNSFNLTDNLNKIYLDNAMAETNKQNELYKQTEEYRLQEEANKKFNEEEAKRLADFQAEQNRLAEKRQLSQEQINKLGIASRLT